MKGSETLALCNNKGNKGTHAYSPSSDLGSWRGDRCFRIGLCAGACGGAPGDRKYHGGLHSKHGHDQRPEFWRLAQCDAGHDDVAHGDLVEQSDRGGLSDRHPGIEFHPRHVLSGGDLQESTTLAVHGGRWSEWCSRTAGPDRSDRPCRAARCSRYCRTSRPSGIDGRVRSCWPRGAGWSGGIRWTRRSGGSARASRTTRAAGRPRSGRAKWLGNQFHRLYGQD